MKPQDDVKPDEGQSASTVGLGRHAWKFSPGVWESDYFCTRCKAHHQQRHDIPSDTEPPEHGCIPNSLITSGAQGTDESTD